MLIRSMHPSGRKSRASGRPGSSMRQGGLAPPAVCLNDRSQGKWPHHHKSAVYEGDQGVTPAATVPRSQSRTRTTSPQRDQRDADAARRARSRERTRSPSATAYQGARPRDDDERQAIPKRLGDTSVVKLECHDIRDGLKNSHSRRAYPP